MRDDIDKVLITAEHIARRVHELAHKITADISTDSPDGRDVTIVPILTGAMVFCADLVRQMPLRMRIGMLAISSYPGTALNSHGSELLGQRLGDIRGHNILLVDDILDSGGTIRQAVPALRELGARSVRSCVLLRKDRPEARALSVDYCGFDIPDVFVVGYGLDYNNYYRNLPDICTLRKHVLEARA